MPMAHSAAALCRAAADDLARLPEAAAPRALVGFDGFVDHIIDVVATRTSRTEYVPMPGLATLGARISAAAGRSANLELVVKQSKIGGNGPIMANGLASHGCRVTAVGILGAPALDPVFAPLAARAERVVSLGQPAVTDALEFTDGKLMLGKLFPLEEVTYANLLRALDGVAGLKETLRAPQGIATVNWTMTLELTAIWEQLVAEILPGLRPDRPLWFVDLADPAKRTQADLAHALATLQRIEAYAEVVLGLNEAECRQLIGLIGQAWPVAASEWQAAEQACRLLRDHFGYSTVMCHLVKSSAVAWRSSGVTGSASAEGFFTPKPMLTTGAGDHFNAGFFTGLLHGLAPARCLQIGGATSGHYVRHAASPSRSEVIEFLRNAAI